MMAGPALLAALGVCAVEGRRVLQPQAALFAAPFVFSLDPHSPAESRFDGLEQARLSLEGRLTAAVEIVDPRTAVSFTDRISVAPALLDTLAPLVGLLLRGQETAA